MTIGLFVWLAITMLIGYAAVSAIWPAQTPRRLPIATVRLALAIGLGMGIASCAQFIALVLFGPVRLPAVGADVIVLVLLVLLARVRARRTPGSEAGLPMPAPPGRLDRTMGWGMVGLLVIALITTVAFVLETPQGNWDAWGIYNLTARFVYLGGATWHHAFSQVLGIHPDYPLLLPGSVVRGWLYVGRDSVVVPIVVSGLFAYATLGLLAGSVWLLRGRRHGALVGVALLGTPFFLNSSAWQYADLPLAFFFLATIVFFALAERLPEDASWLLAASGLCAGLAAWTKNEGLLYVLILFAGLLVAHRRLLRDRADRRAIYAFLAGLIPVLAMVAYFKLAFAPPNDLVSGQGPATLHRILDMSRYWTIVGYAARILPRFPIILVALFLAVVGLDRTSGDRRAIGLGLFAIVLSAAGYFAVYVVTPLDLAVQLHRSLDRLVLQLLPLFLFAAFLVARIPEQGIGAEPQVHD